MIKLKLQQIVDTDKNGVELKDKEGNLLYYRNDSVALLQLLSTVDNRSVNVNEYMHLLTIYDRVKEAWRKDAQEIELGIDEAALLKKIMSDPPQADGRVSFGIFHIRTINAMLEQLK